MVLRALSRFVVALLFVISFSLATALSAGIASAQDSTPTASAPPCQEPGATPAAIDKDTIIATVTAEEDEEDDEDADAAATADPEADPEAESSVVTDEQPVCSVTIEMVDINFNPNQFTMPADQPVELMFRNDGKLPHDFTQEQLGIDVDVDAGESASVVVNVPAGDYQYFCEQPGHAAAGMVGVMHVVDQG